MNTTSVFLAFTTAAAFLLGHIQSGRAQGTTAFTYQGHLRDRGTNANGYPTMTFRLYDAHFGGNQIGTDVTLAPLVVNGVFSADLDFGPGAFTGPARWLQILVGGETMTPRRPVTPLPYALHAAVASTVSTGAIMNAQLAPNAVAATNIQDATITAPKIAANQVVKSINGLTDAVTFSPGANLALTASGNSLQLSALTSPVPNGIQLFLSDGTFVVPSNITRIMVEMWGGGGAGGPGYFDPLTGTAHSGGGGGAGGYALQLFTVTPGSTYSVIVGPGGVASAFVDLRPGAASSFGGVLMANGGGGGNGGSGSANGVGGDAPAPATGSLFPAQIGSDGGDGSNEFGGKGGGAFRGNIGGFGHPLDPVDGGRPGGGGGGGRSISRAGDGGGGIVLVTY
jgi:hypothetical protein